MWKLFKVVWNLRDSYQLVIDVIRKLWALAQFFTWKCKRSLSLYDLVTELTCKLTLYNALCYHGINRLNDYISQCKKLLIQIISSYFNFPMTIWSGRPVPALHMFELENSITRFASLNWPLNTWTGRVCSSNTDNYNIYKVPITKVLL